MGLLEGKNVLIMGIRSKRDCKIAARHKKTPETLLTGADVLVYFNKLFS